MDLGGGKNTSELNFDVKSYSSLSNLLADSPSENTIGIVTDTEITSYDISYLEPESKSEGMIWIYTITNSNFEFNALKENSLRVYPCKAQQYINGEWINREVQMYKDNTWTLLFFAIINIIYPIGSICTATDGVTMLTAPDTSGTWECVIPNAGIWTVSVSDKVLTTESVEITGNNQSAQVDISKYYLYRNGNEYVSRTGGWITNNYVTDQYTAGTLNRNADNMEMIASSSVNQNVILRTNQKINLTNINKLTINVISHSGAQNASDYIGAYLYIRAYSLVGEYPGKEIAFVELPGTGLFSLDVSAITGEYYVIVSCYGASIKFNQVGAEV